MPAHRIAALGAGRHIALLACLLLCLAACGDPAEPVVEPVSATSAALVGDGTLEANEQCDDGNTVSGDGCSGTGSVEAGYLCHVPGRPCSLASLCGNDALNSGEVCDDGNTVAASNGCSPSCDLALCGNGVVNSRAWPNFDQEVCDDGNRVSGDGCSSLCTLEVGFACTGSPSRCVASGVAVFSTGVDDSGRRLEAGADPHWRYQGTATGAAFTARNAADWPHELASARFMASPNGPSVCVEQDFLIPSTMDHSTFRLAVATFNDNAFDSARVNGVPTTPLVISEPVGQPFQKNIVRRFTSMFRPGLNRISLCNNSFESEPNAFRYLIADAFDDRCGDGRVSVRELCDDGNTTNGDGCSNQCQVEPGLVCAGEPSRCGDTCGNGALNAGEECDDGNSEGSDGCDDRCRVEPGYACATAGQACEASCGDGVLDAGELCDDGNGRSGDGCTASCRVERGFDCVGAPSECSARCGNGELEAGELCDDGNRRSTDGCSVACTLELGYACAPGGPCAVSCGNGALDANEACDDGNLGSGDGCDVECSVEQGYACSRPIAGPSVCTPSCGDGALDVNESCDDGNVVEGDGCSRGCREETGFGCSGSPSACASLCGDGVAAGSEACDDGNTSGGDGCSPGCVVEAGWVCPGAATECFETCGDGVINRGETCDDANTADGDGCSQTCRIEAGFTCSGAPGVCQARCGDGLVSPSEACDDGNATSGDGCSQTCRRELGEACTADTQCVIRCSVETQTCTDDVTAPGAPSLASPEGGETLSDTTPTISGSAEARARVALILDELLFATAQADDAGAFAHTPLTPLAFGSHTLRAVATDPSGNEGPSSATITFTVVACLNDDECASGELCQLGSGTCVPVMSLPDGGVDDAGVADAGIDGGSDAGTPATGVRGGGCSVTSSQPASASPWPLGLLLAVALGVRRARRARATRATTKP